MSKLEDRLGYAEDARKPPTPDPPEVGPFDRDFWRSPLRGRWLTAILGSALLPLVVICGLTGFLSHAAYDPALGSNDVTGGFEKDLYFFDWPTNPAWLYSVTQGLHLLAGLAAVPILLAKLWSVIPKLFERPPARSLAHGLERLTIALLVGSSLFLFITGIPNVEYWLPFSFAFVPAHYYAAMIFVAALFIHVLLKLPIVGKAFGTHGTFRPLGDGLEMMEAADPTDDDLAPTKPADATISRRGMLGFVGAASLGLIGLNIGTNLLPGLRETSLLSARGQSYGDGPGDFQVNKTARSAGIPTDEIGSTWRLNLAIAGQDESETIAIDRDELMAMELSTERLPISCVEGWTTYQTWTGVPLRDLRGMAGIDGDATVLVESLQQFGAFSQATLNPGQVDDERSMLALMVNGIDLPLDHGFPARVIVPALPGVHNTKWVSRMTFTQA